VGLKKSQSLSLEKKNGKGVRDMGGPPEGFEGRAPPLALTPPANCNRLVNN